MPSPKHSFAVGDYVVLDHPNISQAYGGTVYTVAKVNKVNIHVTPIGGGTARSAPMYAARPATAAERATAEKAAKAAPEPLFLGSVVTARGRNGHYVVIALPGARTDRYRVAQLGGTETNTFLSAPRGLLTLVEPANVSVA